jgi:hypothetical protein
MHVNNIYTLNKVIDMILCRRVRQDERYNWAATRETLIVNLPEDLQIDIRRHLFNFIKKVCNKIYFYYSYDY